ncbi:hypothetical protein HDN1F_04660 [gamma proteobacterium HdN1]|nr:hypothetical protein HDN1F_04660 [gamma proteobacterium HdN1]
MRMRISIIWGVGGGRYHEASKYGPLSSLWIRVMQAPLQIGCVPAPAAATHDSTSHPSSSALRSGFLGDKALYLRPVLPFDRGS